MTDQSEPNNDEYTIRDDQRAAMEELERLQKTRADDWNEEKDAEFLQLLQEPGPDYEETLARLEQLNAELEREPSPDPSETRPSRVRFSAELVQVAPSPSPPPEQPMVEEEAADLNEAAAEAASGTAPQATVQQPQRPPQIEADGGGHRMGEVESDGGGDKPEGKKVLLVSENGQYQYVNRREVEADQHAEGSEDENDNESYENGVGESESNGEEQPARPASAAVGQPGSRQQGTERAQRATSANGTGRPGSAPSNGCQDERERDNELAFQAWLRAKRTQKRRERLEQEQRQRKAEAERAEANQREKENGTGFQTWLRSKYQQERTEREHLEAEHREREQQRPRVEGPSFEEWLQAKRQQWGVERKYQEKEREEQHEATEVHTSKQCRKAFRQWLRRKEEQKRHEDLCERQRARITQLALRKSRKSQALANALLVASSYRYMDYYGYR